MESDSSSPQAPQLSSLAPLFRTKEKYSPKNLLSLSKLMGNSPQGQRRPAAGSRLERDSSIWGAVGGLGGRAFGPESHQDGNGYAESHSGDAIAQSVDDLHRREVVFLQVEMESRVR